MRRAALRCATLQYRLTGFYNAQNSRRERETENSLTGFDTPRRKKQATSSGLHCIVPEKKLFLDHGLAEVLEYRRQKLKIQKIQQRKAIKVQV